jgi:hypothetical protein
MLFSRVGATVRLCLFLFWVPPGPFNGPRPSGHWWPHRLLAARVRVVSSPPPARALLEGSLAPTS